MMHTIIFSIKLYIQSGTLSIFAKNNCYMCFHVEYISSQKIYLQIVDVHGDSCTDAIGDM